MTPMGMKPATFWPAAQCLEKKTRLKKCVAKLTSCGIQYTR